MDVITYKFLMGTSAFVIALLGGMLAATTIQPGCGWESCVRHVLFLCHRISCWLFSVSCVVSRDMIVISNLALHFWSLRFRLYFLMSMLVFIRPNVVRWGVVLRQAGVIAAGGVILFVVLFCVLTIIRNFLRRHGCLYYPTDDLYAAIHVGIPPDGA
ncbi:MAG: hypothetical protein ACLTZT_08595 [Butyricimonas faecalis]